MINLLLVFLGGGAGAALRYAVYRAVDGAIATEDAETGRFPLATIIVNVAGSFVLGLLAGLSSSGKGPITAARPRLLLATGLLGGFTTFSTLTLDTLGLLQSQQFAAAAGYTAISLAAGLLAAWTGFLLGTLFS